MYLHLNCKQRLPAQMFYRSTWISPVAGTPFIFARAATSTAGAPSPPAPNSRLLIEARYSRGVDCFSLQLAIIQNHLNGRDSHVRQMRVYSSRAHAAFDIESGALVTHAAPLLRALLFRRAGLQLAHDARGGCVLR
jgi:hypothetical protein